MRSSSDSVIDNTEHSPLVQGWTPSPDGRGTIDIIWSCVLTVSLCSWSVLCLNFPAPGDSYWQKTRRKFYLTGLGIVGPEFIFQIALGQWVSACRSVKDFQQLGYHDWSMTHAFFANMGGFILHSPDCPSFPVTARQIQYLVEHDYMPYPSIERMVLTDKNEENAFIRLVTIGQTLWFVVNSLGRVIQHLAVTTFEITTLAFIFCSLGTFFCWAHKPSIEAETAAIKLTLANGISIAHIVNKAGDRARERQPYCLTPLDFIDPQEWTWNLYWSYWINILKRLHVVFAPKRRPIDRFPNDDYPTISSWRIPVLIFCQVTYAGIHVSGWNFHFPSALERLLWRISTTVQLGSMLVYWLADFFAFHALPALKRLSLQVVSSQRILRIRRHHIHCFSSTDIIEKAKSIADSLRNLDRAKDPALYVPLKAVIPATLVATVYCFTRAYILVEDVIALRSLPTSAYETVRWSTFMPHF
ncbi:MAG: hypothetical protein M1836_003272 [Candelina mexicana]|nr:MAG: hypothetical protein M1836_003272 [Candelina mexicana]